jgi:hypothetical protein
LRRQGSNADGGDCRTKLENTHRTEKREVAYRFHPWAGRIVDIHEVVEKASGHVARCNLDGEEVHRLLELPTWMLDRVACAPVRMDAQPRVDAAALDALTTLLAEVAIAGAASSNIPVAKAQMVSRYENRGDRDAVPAQGASKSSIQDDTIRSVRGTRRRGGGDAGMEHPSGGGSPGSDTPDGAATSRSRGRRSQAEGGVR